MFSLLGYSLNVFMKICTNQWNRGRILKRNTHKIKSMSDVHDIYKLNILVQVLSNSNKKWGRNDEVIGVFSFCNVDMGAAILNI